MKVKLAALMAGLFTLLSFLPLLGAGTANYSYDDAGRLIRVIYDNGAGIDYAYDKMGNKISETVTIPPSVGVKATATGVSEGGDGPEGFVIPRTGNKDQPLKTVFENAEE